MTNNQQENEFTRLINLNQISKSGLEMMLTTSDAECEKLAERFSILKIESVVAKCSIKKLAQKDILLRDLSSHPKLKNCLRVTIGTPDENANFLQEIKKIL